MNPNSSLAQNCVIPAQAGIQQGETSSDLAGVVCQLSRMASSSFSGQNHDVAPLRGRFFNHLDSRLRGNDGLMDYLG